MKTDLIKKQIDFALKIALQMSRKLTQQGHLLRDDLSLVRRKRGPQQSGFSLAFLPTAVKDVTANRDDQHKNKNGGQEGILFERFA
jgi:hypothetical protein